MSKDASDCELTGVLSQLSHFFSWKKHLEDLRDKPYYRQMVEQLRDKGYIILQEDSLFIITEKGIKLLEECR